MMHNFIALLLLIRWKNLLLILLTQCLVRYCLIGSVYNNSGIPFGLPLPGFILLVVSSILIAAGGYVINDFFDVRIDTVNKPQKMVLTRMIPLKKAPSIHIYLTASGLFAGLIASWYAGSIKLIGIQAAISAVLWFYSSKYKRSLLLGNIVIALLATVVPLIVWLYEFYALQKYPVNFSALIPSFHFINRTILIYAGFAFLIHLIREIIKDCIDIKGDGLYQCKTLPIRLGLKKTNLVLIIITLLTALLIMLFLPAIAGKNNWLNILYIGLFVEVPMLIVILNLNKTFVFSKFSASENILKFVLLSGVLNLLFLSFN